jgi:uncharacterized protein YkwD
MRRLPATLAIVAALVAAGAASGRGPAGISSLPGARAPQAVKASGAVTRVPALEEQVLAAINNVRRDHGLGPLRLNRSLIATASQHSMSMAEQGYFDHASLAGAPFWKRIQAKYPPRAGRVWSVGENMVWASPDLSAQRAVELWMASPPHAKNLLSRVWREVGLGAVHSVAAPGVYQNSAVTILTADFGARR